MKEIEGVPAQVRRLEEMREVLYDQDFAKSADPSQPVYCVHRDIPFSRSRCDLSLAELRYDVTLIPPMRLGQEYPKTYGHYHSVGPGGLAYAEVYEVLQGTAHVLLQKIEREKVIDLYVVEGHPGDKLVVPPDHGHVLINPGEQLLATGNSVSRRCAADYEFWRRRKGGACYEVFERRFVKNPTYGDIPEVKMKTPHNSFSKEFRLTDLLLRNPSDFLFLIDPLAYAEECAG
jgi:glucose-6-phosphate isomerase